MSEPITLPPTGAPRRPWRALAAGALALALGLVLAWGVYHRSLQAALDADRTQTTQRLAFYAQTLDAGLQRYETLPALLALEHSLAALLAEPEDPARRHAANVYLEAAQQHSGVTAAYLMDARGHTLAASNWRLPISFVGHSYAFRPYFQAALQGRTGRLYAIGATTGEPGYFLAAPLQREGVVMGVVAIKVALEAFENALSDSGDMVLVADALGVVFIASQQAWRYHSLVPLDAAARAQLAQTRQYGQRPSPPLFAGAGLHPGAASVALALAPGRALLWQSHPIGPLQWQLVVLRDPAVLQRGAWVAAAAAAFAFAFGTAVLAIVLLRQRRRRELQQLHASLERRIAERTTDLSRQVQALERTEGILRQTRDAAVQAGKLAVLGQMAAGMTHELNQPLAALHAYADNAQALLARGQAQAVQENLESISHLAGRLGRLVAQLKTFARKTPQTLADVGLDAALANALLIVEPLRRERALALDCAGVQPGLLVRAEAVRLEQVLVNLLRNALDATAQTPPPHHSVQVQAHRAGTDAAAQVCIRIRDHGCGFDAQAVAHLFEPFFTTKSAGAGLGLGLAISQAIVEGFGGRIQAANAPDGGAELTLWLDAAPPPSARPEHHEP
ncbi:MAG: sensor histidine kinase [Rhodoferax sp.]